MRVINVLSANSLFRRFNIMRKRHKPQAIRSADRDKALVYNNNNELYHEPKFNYTNCYEKARSRSNKEKKYLSNCIRIEKKIFGNLTPDARGNILCGFYTLTP